ncbi:M1 family aminopeptidase [Alteromonas sp. ASW11-19]|uniref:M1 family aminopeptidase n=1 Tax=Alteromonas salexigens TaxID=2982530 RepID=A0ABT2VJM1_9ALTE|nr:M1 family aminopeptidase [Alteromonas salexigens]MCU7553441.1 M1 family aminopeptidase [Alteromonas salexigens]
MFVNSLTFEWRYYPRQPSFYVTLMVFFLLPFLATATDSVRIGGGGNVLYNGSYAITQTTLIMGIFAMFLLVNFVAGTATRNHSSNMGELVYTRPITPLSYHLGRFGGAYLVSLLVFAMVPLGILLGSLMPWVDQERLGPTNLSFYVTTFVYFSVPSMLALGMIFYAVAQRLRSMMGAYLVAMGLFIFYVIGGVLTSDPEYRMFGALSDPFGLRTFAEVSRYWTVFDKNTQMAAMEGVLLQNRLLWLAVGTLILTVFGNIFSLRWQQQARKEKPSKAALMAPPERLNLKVQSRAGGQLNKLFTRIGFEMGQVLFSPALIVLMIFSLFNLSALYFVPIGGLYGTPDWPLTQQMVEVITESYGLMLIIVVTYYSGEIVWRERGSGMGDIVDSTPAFNLVFWVSKLLAMWAVLAVLFTIGIFFTVVYQITQGYFNFEFGTYAVGIYVLQWLPWALMAVLAFFIQVLSPNKFVGMLLFVAYFIVSLVFAELGLEHNMWSFADTPSVPYSDLNGYGWFLAPFGWYMLYWSALSVALFTLGYALWQRGPEVSLKHRFRLLGYQLGGAGKTALAASLLVFVATGGYIHYNTQVLNTYLTSDERYELQAEYERQFAQYENDEIPVITRVNAAVDIYPEERRIEAEADVTLSNPSDTAITRALISVPPHTSAWDFTVPGAKVTERVERLNSAWLTFEDPLQPGETRDGVLSVTRAHQGFKDNSFDFEVAENGTFINNYSLFPAFGFNTQYLISDRHERRKRELPDRPRAHKLEDSEHYAESGFGKGVTFIDFETTVSTSGDQIAIAPGYLQREWQENGRNYFHYKMDAPIVNFFSYLSARHAVKKDTHHGVNIEVYHHPEHHWNVDVMIESVKDSLDYFTDAFGPYQHRQMRIIEFPGYRDFAQSFANTVPYSEDIGFVADLRDPEDIDYVYYVTAHEVAHQWWGHQVGAANVQGQSIIIESLSQYSAIMVLRERYGEEKMRKFLKYELDRYLRDRGGELLAEMPFMRSESQQYIHYRKGSIVMMAILDRLGEERVNLALQNLLNDFQYRNNPYPTTLDLQAALNAQATADEQAFISDLFERITLYDLKMLAAQAVETDNGRYQVSLTVSAARFEADGDGREQEGTLNEWVDVALFTGDPEDLSGDTEVLYNEKHKLESGENIITLTLDKKPVFAGIDPFIKLIDRDSGDNVLKLK